MQFRFILACAVLKIFQAVVSESAARTIEDFGNHCDPAELLQAVQPVSKSVKEDAAQSSSCIWTTLSDLLPQSKASLDQVLINYYKSFWFSYKILSRVIYSN